MFLNWTPLSLKLEQEVEPGLLTGALEQFQTRLDLQYQANWPGLREHPHCPLASLVLTLLEFHLRRTLMRAK